MPSADAKPWHAAPVQLACPQPGQATWRPQKQPLKLSCEFSLICHDCKATLWTKILTEMQQDHAAHCEVHLVWQQRAEKLLTGHYSWLNTHESHSQAAI